MPEREASSPTGVIAGLVDNNLDKIAEQSRALLLLAAIVVAIVAAVLVTGMGEALLLLSGRVITDVVAAVGGMLR